MMILGLESSCDETAVAVVKDGLEVLSSQVASQIEVHALFGGIVPEIAAREHLKVIDPLFHKALTEAGLKIEDIDAIAVTQGPGLIGALLVAVSYAKGLSLSTQKTLVPVDHVEAHIQSAFLDSRISLDEVFPALSLVVSGGHTNLYHMNSPISCELLAYTHDDACGECLDKVAKLFGLPYPGGPEIEKIALKGNPSKIAMPRIVGQKSKMMFSYAGLKTHMAHLADDLGKKAEKDREPISDVFAGFQKEAFAQIIRKLEYVLKKRRKVKSLIVSGGVAANLTFRKMIEKEFSLPLFFPQKKYCSDNAAMIAAQAYQLIRVHGEKRFQKQSWDAYSRYRFD